ncbi:hypothetical protein HPB58_13040 [Priestia filamentosa]|uniref:hypothetical protein n=1 Tax=Priestia filamentosa TaxID=1402861 RepID=UPI001FB43E62|nr:hypothetical protein [Priestia filamentosa]UOE58282.1 hypothetical protein HPB58_13040 [Priestia filamentosa]
MNIIWEKWKEIITHESLKPGLRSSHATCIPYTMGEKLFILIHESDCDSDYEAFNLKQIKNAIYKVTGYEVECEYSKVKEKINLEKSAIKESLRFALDTLSYITQNDFQSQDLNKRSNEDYIIDTVRGKLAEYIFNDFYLSVEKKFTFEIDNKIYKSTIETDNGNDLQIIYNIHDKTYKYFNNLKIDIKASKKKAQWLLVEEKKSFSDIYILVRLEFEEEKFLPPNTINSEKIHDSEYKQKKLNELIDIFSKNSKNYNGTVVGYAFSSDIIDPITNKPWFEFKRAHGLIRKEEVPKIFVQNPQSLLNLFNENHVNLQKSLKKLKAKTNYGVPADYLRNSLEDWAFFFSMIRQNSINAGNTILNRRFPQLMNNRTKEGIMQRVAEIENYFDKQR